MSDQTPTVLIAAGGTGGHIFPGLATAAALVDARPDLNVEFVGTADRLEARLVPQAGWTLHTVPAAALSRKLSPKLLTLPLVIGKAVQATRKIISERNVVAAVGFGGYTSVPLAFAARTASVPLIIHESNAVPGVTNRVAAKSAAAVALSFPEAAARIGGGRKVLTGNPVRPDLFASTADDAETAVPLLERRLRLRNDAITHFGLDPGSDRRTILVFGGSQGAKAINEAVTGAAAMWSKPGSLQILHGTGKTTHDETMRQWRDAGVDPSGGADSTALNVVATEFIDRMDLAYAVADLVVCRAGASSIAELTVLGLPSILVPYPYATDDHQMANARGVEKADGAIVIPDAELNAERLIDVVDPLVSGGDRLEELRAGAVEFSRPNAANDLAALVLEIADGKTVRSRRKHPRPVVEEPASSEPLAVQSVGNADPTDDDLNGVSLNDPASHVHFIGVGGAGMRAQALVLTERGLTVSGSDLRGGATVADLIDAGIDVSIGHTAENIVGADLVAVSNAVPEDNPELAAARESGVPVIGRAELLGAMMADRTAVLVSGTHGKTTTTAMIISALTRAAFDPSYVVGGSLPSGPGAHHGEGTCFIAEADEAFRSFLHLPPDIAVVTNVEMDHHDEYDDIDAYRDAFVQWLSLRPSGSPAFLCADDPGSADLIGRIDGPVIGYGTTPDADAVIGDVTPTDDGGTSFTITVAGDTIGLFTIGVPGTHNVLNAAATVLVARQLNADLTIVNDALATFTGALRRFQRIGEVNGVSVIDDYGHHPTEIAATLQAARQLNEEGRIVAVFQPHRYTRTEAMGHELGVALASADVVIVAPIYAASEDPIDGVSAELVLNGVRSTERTDGPVIIEVLDNSETVTTVRRIVRPNDIVLTIGAGDITNVGPQLLALLRSDGA